MAEHTYEAALLFDPEVEPGYMKHYVGVPEDVVRALTADGARRFVGSIGGEPFRRSLHERPDGSFCLKFGAGWLRDARLAVGDIYEIELGIDPDPDRVDVPVELEHLLAANDTARAKWNDLTPGKQRTMAYGVLRAKQVATRERRARKLIEELLS